jgi:V8-like Glu-specific endopeptidase
MLRRILISAIFNEILIFKFYASRGIMKYHLTIICFAILTFNITISTASDIPKIIYGNDDRYEASEYPDAMFRDLAKSTAGMVKNSSLTEDRDSLLSDDHSVSNLLTFNKYRTLERTMNVCSTERFKDQVSLPRCSGFLVAPDVLVTAGHCVTNAYDCENYSWVFDYVKGTEKIDKKNVYKCKSIISRKQTLGILATKDYAVVKLDRVAEDRTPLKFRKRGSIKKGTGLVVIGHPSGLPLKIADGAEVTKKRWKFFYANLDTYGGNSGSAVFNQKTAEVEGILIQGAKDYIRNGICNVSNRTSNSNAKEKVFKITKVKGIK